MTVATPQSNATCMWEILMHYEYYYTMNTPCGATPLTQVTDGTTQAKESTDWTRGPILPQADTSGCPAPAQWEGYIYVYTHTQSVLHITLFSCSGSHERWGRGFDKLPVCALVSSLNWVDQGFILGWGVPVNQPLLPFTTLQLCPHIPQAAYST